MGTGFRISAAFLFFAIQYMGRTTTAADSVANTFPPMIAGATGTTDVSSTESTQICAVDSAGNRYIVGSFNFAQDFNPLVGADVKTPVFDTANGVSSRDGFVTRFNADGSYAWTQTFGGSGDDYGYSVAVSNGVVYVTGQFGSLDFQINGTGTKFAVNGGNRNLPDGYVIALDAQTGAPKTTFGVGGSGIQTFGGTSYDGGLGITVANSTLYIAGYSRSTLIQVNATGPGAPGAGGADAIVVVLDAVTGNPKTTFGSNASGVQALGSTSDDFAFGILVNANTVYVAGYYGGTFKIAGNTHTVAATTQNAFVSALDATTGQGIAAFGVGSSGIQTFGGSSFASASGVALLGSTIYVSGYFGGTDAKVGGAGTAVPNAGSNDAYVMALDAANGSPRTGFGVSGTGVQTFGGTGADRGSGVLVANNAVYVTGNFASTDAKIGGAGTAIGTNGSNDSFIICLDPTTGAAKATFGLNGTGIQKFGGSGIDLGFGLMQFSKTVYVAGFCSSASDVGLGALGTISTANFNSFLLPLNMNTGNFLVEGNTTINLSNLLQVYDGNPHVPTVVTTPGGLSYAVTYNGSLTVPTKAGTYSILVKITDPNFTGIVGDTMVVSPAPLSVAANPASRPYGRANPTLTGTLTGAAASDGISANYTCTASATSPVGTYTITPALVDPNSKLSNYTVTSTNNVLTVNLADLSVTPDNFSRPYASFNPVFTGVVAGVQNNEAISATYSTSATKSSPAGSYAIVPALVDPNHALSNYALHSSNGTLTIMPVELSVVADDLSRMYGAANPALTGTLAGLQNGDQISVTYSTAATTASPAGNYAITPALTDPNNALPNYALDLHAGTLSVSPAPLSVAALSASRVYRSVDPLLSGSVTGIQNNDAISAMYFTLSEQQSPVGDYPIYISMIDPNNKLTNYAVTLVPGTFSITKGTPAIIWPAPVPVFAGMNLDQTQLNATASDLFTQESIAGTFSYTPDAGTVLGLGLAQPLHAAFSPDDSTNYFTTAADNSVDVIPALPVVITSSLTAFAQLGAGFSYTITVDGSAPFAFNAENLPAGLTFSGNTISGIPTASGVFRIPLSASNFGGMDTQTLKLTVLGSGSNHAPVMASPPAALVDPLYTGVATKFFGQASDIDGDALDYTWDFGDGTTGVGASVSKAFDAAGIYSVTLTVTDGQANVSETLVMLVTDLPANRVFSVQKVNASFNFVRPNMDILTVAGQIPVDPGFSRSGKSVRIVIGGVDRSYTLDDKGVSPDFAFSLQRTSVTMPDSGMVGFSFVLKKSALYPMLKDFGFTQTTNNPAIGFPVILVLDGHSHYDRPLVVYSVKGNRNGPVNATARE
ncbi:MAG TPA: MBG domain-containing protein [Planctomycetota bacterium]|nr:MBG domain-containing protein [Planctomycetota bacterium]